MVHGILPPNYIDEFGGWDESQGAKMIARLCTVTASV
jgi:hypothetical protein